jgi:hypothetical protein
MIGSTTSLRFQHYQASEMTKDHHPHLTAFATSGTGKSALAEAGLALLRESTLPPELEQALQAEGGSLSVLITFNSNTPFCELDKDNIEAAMGSRLLSSYFGCKWSVLQSSPIYHRLSVSCAIKCILLDHRARHKLSNDSLVLLYLAVDDAGQVLTTDAPIEWTTASRDEHHRRYLKRVALLLGQVLLDPPDEATFPVSMLTGTTTKAMHQVMSIDSSHPYRQCAVPLLSFEDCLELFRILGWEHWSASRECQQLLADLGGIPRLVDFLCGQIRAQINAGRNPESANWISIKQQTENESHRRYHPEGNAAVVRAVLKAAMTRVPVAADTEFEGVTWELLQRAGSVFLHETTDPGLFTVSVPFLVLKQHIQNHLSVLPSATSLLFNMPPSEYFEAATWEKFNLVYDAVCASLCQGSITTVADFYRGALVHPDVAGVEFRLTGDVKYVRCKNRFPQAVPPRFRSRPHHEIPWTTGRFSILNAGGAGGIDGFTGNPGRDRGTLLRVQQHKWNLDLGHDISLAEVRAICTKVCLFVRVCERVL